MENIIETYLKSYKKLTISLSQIERIFNGDVGYEEFAEQVLELVEKGILEPKNLKQNNGKKIALPYKYHINKSLLNEEFSEKIKQMQLKLNENINIQIYISLGEKEWENDLPYILKINDYLIKNGIPEDEVTSSERSFQIVGDEKWIDEKDGKKILERLNIWNILKIDYNLEPLMMAVNPKNFAKEEYMHLIVENKTTFYSLIDTLNCTSFTSLIYGCGWKIVGNIHNIDKQLGAENKRHILYYFGDLDFEGITIWSTLNDKFPALLAVDFYKALLKKKPTVGKQNQQRDEEALLKFLSNFNEEEQKNIMSLLDNKMYYPQEALNKKELWEIWRSMR